MREKTESAIAAVALILTFALGFYFRPHVRPVEAQAPGPSLVYANGPASACPALPIPNGGALLCLGSDHVMFAPAGATKYLQLDSQAVTATGVTSVNGQTGAVTVTLTPGSVGTLGTEPILSVQ